MKAITIHQPWASLIAVGAKQFETRSRPTKYRGRIAIHAGMKDGVDLMTSAQINALPQAFAGTRHEVTHDRPGGGFDYVWPYGAIIATADLVECHKITGHQTTSYSDDGKVLSADHCTYFENIPGDITGDELLFGDWEWGRYAWELANVQMLPEPIPAKGRQGLWNWEGAA